ncbi:hypothetical protein DRQ50_04620 [bacterium]|nr:MAG: hypothetical protein DRQ50_04620 [bacterium]
MHPVVIVAIIIAGVALAIVVFRADQERKRLLRAWARSKGLRLKRIKKRGWEKEYPAFKLLTKGHHRHSSLHIEGEVDGKRVRCVDYRYTTGSGKNRQTHSYALVVMDTCCPVVPLHIRREHLFDRVGEFFGHDDIDFESAEFSRKFHVAASDRRWAYDVIHQKTMDYLLETPSVTIEFGYAEIAVYRTGALSAERCQEALKVARRMFDLIPDDVLAQLKGDAS